ncbi:DUF4388 domain-containing protein [Coleofasciculus sp.]|uniref:DUF4388 domain-containing protein n=1 Tax=Coleofasciculus sp. TaxID=3100458 RepID=UPI0039F8705C
MMCTQGTFTDFPLPTIFKWLDQGRKTGVLSIHPLSAVSLAPYINLRSNVVNRIEETRKPSRFQNYLHPQSPIPNHYIWIAQGQIVAAANRCDGGGLISLLQRDQWVSDRVLSKLLQRCSLNHQPLGLWLKNNGVLDSEQLKQIFHIQIIEQIVPIFQLKDAQFKFDLNTNLSAKEMTGLSIAATEATMMISGKLQFVSR